MSGNMFPRGQTTVAQYVPRVVIEVPQELN